MEPDNSELYRSPEGYRRAMAFYDDLLSCFTVPYDTRFLETRYGVTHVISAGPEGAPSVVFWHGLDASAPTWWRQINALTGQYRCYAPDVLGSMGRSAPACLDRVGTAYGEWAADVIAGLGIEQAHQVGISNGGWLILKLATVAPEKIASAVLISSAGFVGVGFMSFLRMLPWMLTMPFRDEERRARSFVRVISPLEPDERDVTMTALLLGHFKAEQAPGPLSDVELATLTAPTYLMLGEHEVTFNTRAAIKRAQAILPNLNAAEIVPEVGHGMISEKPEEVNNRLMTFLAVNG